MKHNLSEDILRLFEQYLISNGKSPNTISSYLSSVKAYIWWFQDRFQKVPQQLFVENVADYKVFLQQREVAPSTFNSRMAGLRSWNEYLIQTKMQDHSVIQKEDWKKVQHGYASPAVHSEADVQRFIQTVLESRVFLHIPSERYIRGRGSEVIEFGIINPLNGKTTQGTHFSHSSHFVFIHR